MGLLTDKIEGLDYAKSALANYQPQQAPQDLSFLDKLAIAFVPQTYANIQGQRAAMNQPQGADYKQLAEYWAQQGDPQKAQQYAELAQAQSGVARTGLAPQIGVNPETQRPEYFVIQEGGIPKFTGVTPQERVATQQRTATPRVPVGMMWDPEQGRAVQIPGVPVKPAAVGRASSGSPAMPKPVKTTEDERKAAGWLQQARKAYSDMMDAYQSDPSSASPGLVEQYAPVEEMRNTARSPSRQRYAQAASAFAEATLRAATGAGVTIDEAKQKIAELTPQRGDSEEVIRQKMASQQVYLESLEARAGNAKLPSPVPPAGNQTMKTLPPASQYPGAIIRDTKFGKRFRSNGKTWEPL